MERADSANTADLILDHVRVITLDPEHPYAEIVAVKGNGILAVGVRDDIGRFRGARTRVIDCQGGTLIPGFNDAHCHPLSFAISLISVNCSPDMVSSITEIQARIRDRAKHTAAGRWIRAVHYDEFHLRGKRPPHRWELDEASPDHPVLLLHRTGGKCVLNSLALRLAGITKDTLETAGGVIHRDPQTGEPDGRISGRNDRVAGAVPPISADELAEGMKLADKVYLSQGITSIQDTSWNNGRRQWQMWQLLKERGVISPRVLMLAGTESLEEFQEAGLSTRHGNSELRLGGMKLALDESTGCPHPPQEDINRLALRAHQAGFQLAFHVSDLPALEASLDAIAFITRRVPTHERRFRIEHCPVCPPELLHRLRDCRAVVVTQPSFLYYMASDYREWMASRHIDWLWPIGSFCRSGITVAFSSDSPMVASTPLKAIGTAATRKTSAGDILAPEERISPLQALEMHTRYGAYASLEEDVKGSIGVGKLADLVVLSDDLTVLPAEQLGEVSVVKTIIGGRVVWEA